MNWLAAAEVGAALLGSEAPTTLAADGVLLKDVFAQVDPSGSVSIAALAKLPKDDLAGAMEAASRQLAALAKVVRGTEYGYGDVCEILTST